MLLLLILITTTLSAAHDPFADEIETPPALPKPTSEFIPVHYAQAADLAKFINNKQAHLLSQNGYAMADVRTNQLWIQATPAHLYSIHQLIKKLDIPTPQLLIKVRIISIDESHLNELGIIFKLHTPSAPTPHTLILDTSSDSNHTSITDIPILKLSNGQILDLTLAALAEDGRARLISSPELMTNDRQTASIESGNSIPYQEKTREGSTSISFKQATLRLEVTPTLLPQHHILLHLIINQDQISPIRINGVPAITTRHMVTQVIVDNKDTVVLGGIYEQRSQDEQSGIPILRRIPILGILFRHHQHTQQRKKLLIFVTPTVIAPLRPTHPILHPMHQRTQPNIVVATHKNI